MSEACRLVHRTRQLASPTPLGLSSESALIGLVNPDALPFRFAPFQKMSEAARVTSNRFTWDAS